MLSQTYFLWPGRTGPACAPGRLPPVSRLLRLESLEADLLAFCAERAALAFCRDNLRGGLPRLNQGQGALRRLVTLPRLEPRGLSEGVSRALASYYARDCACLNYSRATPDRCI